MRGFIRLSVQALLLAAGNTGAGPASGGKPHGEVRTVLLDAAVARFATVGFGGPLLRELPGAAGVSPEQTAALFPNEGELRRACDDYVLEDVVGWARQKATLEGMSEVMRSYAADPGAYQAQIGYLGRAVAENTPAAPRFVDVLVAESESIIRAGIADGTMRPSDDPRALAVLLATTVLGMITMAPHIERTLGISASLQQMLLRLAVPALELYTHGLYTDDSYLTLVRQAVSALPPGQDSRQSPGAGSPAQ